MKCVKKGKTIKRVSDEAATRMIQTGYEYCPKSEWKENVRDKKKKEDE